MSKSYILDGGPMFLATFAPQANIFLGKACGPFDVVLGRDQGFFHFTITGEACPKTELRIPSSTIQRQARSFHSFTGNAPGRKDAGVWKDFDQTRDILHAECAKLLGQDYFLPQAGFHLGCWYAKPLFTLLLTLVGSFQQEPTPKRATQQGVVGSPDTAIAPPR